MRNISENTLKKYKLIIDEWFNNRFNGKQAYLKYYKRVKDDTATTNFSKIQALPELKEYINEKYILVGKIIGTKHEDILKELVNWVSSDITETMELEPEQIKLLPIGLRRLITKYKTTTRDIYSGKGDVIETVKTVELHFVSKERAIEMINKHIGFYEADNKQKAPVIDYSLLNADTLKSIWDARK